MNNKKIILISCVNYNTYDKLEKYILSIQEAYFFSMKEIKISILIGDNSTNFEELKFKVSDEIKIIHSNNNKNLGYIGGVTKALEISKIKIEEFDYFVISNVDLTLDKTFFTELGKQNIEKNIAWIAPAIISEKEKRDRNPNMQNRPSLMKINLIIIMYQFPILHYLYKRFIYKYRDKKMTKNTQGSRIYAGHGSFMLFTKSFTSKNKNINFPSFLYGEEIFFAELIRKVNLRTIYEPKLIISDFDHVNTSKIKTAILDKMNYDSMKMIKKMFF